MTFNEVKYFLRPLLVSPYVLMLMLKIKFTKDADQTGYKTRGDIEREALPELREVSRQKYLEKREEKKLEELKDALEDEKYLFEGVNLTER